MKLVTDAAVIFQLEVVKVRAWFGSYVLTIVAFPIGMLYFAKALVPPGSEDQVGTQVMTGALVFGLGLVGVNTFAQMLLAERFNSMLKLVITSPVHPLSYVAGVVSFAVAQGLVTAAVVLSFAPLTGIDVHLSLWLIPILIITSLSLAGIAVVIATRSPGLESGGMFASAAGILVVLLSPVYYPIERLPEWMQWVAQLSPYTHAGAAVNDILSGEGGFAQDLVILALITVVASALGIAGLRWSED